MRTEDLKNYGVHDLDTMDMNAINGGNIALFVSLLCTYVIVEAALNPNASLKAFKEGWDSYDQMMQKYN
jgi:hypothetical protein